VAKDTCNGGDIQPFGERHEHLTHPLGGRFEPIQRRGAAGREGGTTGLAAERLDAFGLPVRAVSNEGVDVGIRDPVVSTGRGRTGEPLRGDALGCTGAGF
jgi:hypothetical protein